MHTPSGERNVAVRIERKISVPDGQGGHVATWGLRAVVYAKVEPLSGEETIAAQQLTGVLLSAVTIPFRDDFSNTDRLLIGSRVLNVRSYQDESGRRTELRILCSEVQA
jgi:SPP1 family predicted phage head-tail adaptor